MLVVWQRHQQEYNNNSHSSTRRALQQFWRMLFAGSVVSFAVTVVSVACKTVPSVVHLGCTAIDCGRLITRTLWVKHASCLPRSISTTTFLLGHQPQRYHDCSTKDQLSPTPPTATADNRKSGVLASFRSRSREKYNDKTADEVELYFAYGANMSPTVLTGKRGVEPLASLPAEVVAFATAAPDYERGAGILGPLDRGIAGGGGGGGGGIYTCFCHRAGVSVVTFFKAAITWAFESIPSSPCLRTQQAIQTGVKYIMIAGSARNP